MPSTVYINNGNGQFTDEGAARGLPTGTSDNGIAFGDIDNDGDMDIVLTNVVYRNNGNGYFTHAFTAARKFVRSSRPSKAKKVQ